MALLAAYLIAGKPQGMSLEAFLEEKIFSGLAGSTIEPTPEELEGFEVFTRTNIPFFSSLQILIKGCTPSEPR